LGDAANIKKKHCNATPIDHPPEFSNALDVDIIAMLIAKLFWGHNIAF
jgi:hypothetical protein